MDKTAPNNNSAGAQLVFSDQILTNGVTPELIDARGGKVDAEIPRYPGIQSGDGVKSYWGDTLASERLFTEEEVYGVT